MMILQIAANKTKRRGRSNPQMIATNESCGSNDQMIMDS